MLILVLPIIFSGLIDVFSRSSFASPPLYEIFNQEEQATAAWIEKNISPKENILTGSSHLNLVDSLAGKPVLLGYPGWLWTHGIDYSQRYEDVKSIFLGEDLAKTLLKKYQIDFVMIGRREKEEYNLLNQGFFDQNYPVVFQSPGIKIYKVK